MYYTRIIKYAREGDIVIPHMITKAHGYTGITVLGWSSLYGGHTEWIDRYIKERANARAPRRRYA